MRICFTAEEFFPVSGGRPRRIYETARILAKQHEVHVYCQRYSSIPNESIIDGIHVHRIGIPIHTTRSYFSRLLSSSAYFHNLLLNRFNMVDTSFLFPPIFSYAASKLKGTLIVFTCDGLTWAYEKNMPTGILHPLLIPVAFMVESVDIHLHYDAVIVVSSGVKEELTDRGVPQEKIFVVHPGVDLEFIDSVSYERKNESPSLCYVGNLDARKHVLDLIYAFKNIIDEFPSAQLVIAGSGQLYSQAKKMVDTLRLSNSVKFAGPVSFSNAIRIMKESDCLILPSTIEGFGLVLVEAMACGKPVIAYNIRNVQDAVRDGYNGFLVAPRNIPLLTQKIKRILRDPSLGEKMGKRGRKMVEKYFTWKKTAEKTINVYRKVLGAYR